MARGGDRPMSDALAPIYFAMAAGVVTFALVAAFALEAPLGDAAPGPLRAAWIAVAAGVVVLAAVLPGRRAADGRTTALLVWGGAEGQALLGIVGYLVSGDRLLLILPVALFAYLFLRHPPSVFRSPSR